MFYFQRTQNTSNRSLLGFLTLLFFALLLVSSQPALAGSDAGSLVETQWMADNLKTPSVSIVHVGSFFAPYDQDYKPAHVPGARYMSVGDVMNVLGNGSKSPDMAAFEGVMGRLGISNDSHVVLYGNNGSNALVATSFWLMKYFGHNKVSIMNGGFAKWTKEKRETSASAETAAPSKYKASANESMYANADTVLKGISDAKTVIIDVRSADEYKGLKSMGPAPKIMGHIKGAVNLDYEKTNLNQDGTFRSANDLRSAYEAQGVKKDKDIIVYCDGGVRASNTVFVLKYLLGYPNVRNYVGSWGEWGNRLDPAKYPAEK